MDWITPALSRLHRENQDLAVILAELLKRQGEIIKRLDRPAVLPKPKFAPYSPKIASAAFQWLIAIMTAIYIFRGGDIGTALKALSLLLG